MIRASIERAPARPGSRFMLRANHFLATGETQGWREEFERLVGGIDHQPRWLAVNPLWQLLRDDARVQQIIRSRFPGAP